MVTVHEDTGKKAPSPQDVIARVKDSVVLVLVERSEGVVSGSGFPVSGDRVATCAHVVEGAQRIQVLTPGGSRIDAQVDKTDSANDVALLSCGPGLPPALKLASLNGVREGDEIAVTGYPVVDRFLELGYQPVSSTSRGTVSAKRTRQTDGGSVEQIQTDAAINEGNSGGPLYSLRTGEVLGLAAAKFADESGINFASAAEAVRVLLPGSGGVSASSGPVALFSVDGQGDLDPIAMIQNGRLSEPPHPSPDGDSQDVLRFVERYFHAGNSYHVLFGGADAGTVQVVERKGDSGLALTARAELHASAPLRGRILALATDSGSLARPSRSRRPARKAEREAALRLASDAFKVHGVSEDDLASIEVVNLTATDLTGDGKDDLVGSFRVTTNGQEQNLFCILESQGDDYKPAVTELHTAQDPSGSDRQEESLVDRADLDGDGTAEVVSIVRGSAGAEYRVYSRKGGHWQSIYHTLAAAN